MGGQGRRDEEYAGGWVHFYKYLQIIDIAWGNASGEQGADIGAINVYLFK